MTFIVSLCWGEHAALVQSTRSTFYDPHTGRRTHVADGTGDGVQIVARDGALLCMGGHLALHPLILDGLVGCPLDHTEWIRARLHHLRPQLEAEIARYHPSLHPKMRRGANVWTVFPAALGFRAASYGLFSGMYDVGDRTASACMPADLPDDAVDPLYEALLDLPADLAFEVALTVVGAMFRAVHRRCGPDGSVGPLVKASILTRNGTGAIRTHRVGPISYAELPLHATPPALASVMHDSTGWQVVKKLRAVDDTGKEAPDDLFIHSDRTVKVGTVASPSSLTRAIRFHHAEFVPVSAGTTFLYDVLDLRPDSLLAEQFVAPVVLPKGVTITKVRARGYREGRPPQVSSVTTTAFGSDATDHNVSMPASVASGDLLLMLFVSDGVPSHATPSGWTALGSGTAPSGADIAKITVFGKVATGSEGGTTVNVVTGAAETAAAHVYRVITWSGSLAGVELSSFASNTNANPDPASLSPSWGDPTLPRTLWLAVFGENNQSAVNAYPTNYTGGTFTASGGTNGCGVGSARRQRDIETEDPGAFTLAASQGWVAVTIAIRPSLTDSLDALSMILYRQVSDGATNIATVAHDSAGWQTKEASLSQLVGEEAYTLLLSLNADVSPQDVRFQHAEIEYTRPDYAQTY